MSTVASREPLRRKSQSPPEVRQAVKDLLTRSSAFVELSPKAQTRIAHDTVLVVDYLVRPARDVGDASGNLIERVDFPAFVASLIKGVFHAIVDSSIQQMKAYGKLVADVAGSLNKFRDQNLSDNQARNYLSSRFPQFFRGTRGRKKRIPLRLATKRQQLLATMLLMGINRIVVTDGKIRAPRS
jgi:hypothetical protein